MPQFQFLVLHTQVSLLFLKRLVTMMFPHVPASSFEKVFFAFLRVRSPLHVANM